MHDQIPKVATQTPDLGIERQNQLRELFPEAWSEGELDFSKLRTLLGDLSDESAERYRFGWAGKRESLQLLQTPSRATLRPALDESVDFDATQNLFIEGDNLEALKLLYKPLFNRVKMIYIDPPYNTGNDFIYPDNFSDPLKNYLIQTGQKDANGDLQTSAPDVAGRVHSRWLSMLYPRLTLARSLLRDDGVIFVSIDDNEVHHLRLLMNEVFGEENFVASFQWQKVYSPRMDASGISPDHDFILAYARSEEFSTARQSFEQNESQFTGFDEKRQLKYRPRSLRKEGKGSNRADRPNLFYALQSPDKTDVLPIKPDGTEGRWRVKQSTFDLMVADEVIEWGKVNGNWQVFVKQYFNPEAARPYTTIWPHTEVGHNHEAVDEVRGLLGSAPFDNPKPTRLIKRMMGVADATYDDIILDFFAGSGTTAQAVLELNREDGGNRRFVLVQLPELTGNAQFPTIADIGKERIRRVIARMKAATESKAGLAPSSNLSGSASLSSPANSVIQFEAEGLEEGASPALLETEGEQNPSPAPEDLGFKVWKLGESHFRQMQPVEQGDVAAYLEQLELMNDALLLPFEPRAVLYEVALREGFGLNCSLEPVPNLEGVSVWRVSDADKGQHFFATLDDSLALESLRPLKLSLDDLFICRGIALDDDTAANLALQCRLKMI